MLCYSQTMMVTIEQIRSAMAETGFAVLGALHPKMADDVPPLASGQGAKTLVLIGNAGPAMWRVFAATRNPCRDRLDAWSAEAIASLAAGLGAEAVYPWSRPHHPFQRWCRQAGITHPSPLGLDIHGEFGLWWAVRAALLLPDRLDLPARPSAASPCQTCPDRPCLSACPVSAFSDDGYDVSACVDHLAQPAGGDCMSLGCQARRACPIGIPYRHGPDQARFHMTAFLSARAGGD